jgi:hypothetical protein
MPNTIKDAAKTISEELGCENEAVVHMFHLISFNVKHQTNITDTDLFHFGKKWNMSKKEAGLILASCMEIVIDNIGKKSESTAHSHDKKEIAENGNQKDG